MSGAISSDGRMPRKTRNQVRMNCGRCGAEWWYSPGSLINPNDHRKPSGQRCAYAKETKL